MRYLHVVSLTREGSLWKFRGVALASLRRSERTGRAETRPGIYPRLGITELSHVLAQKETLGLNVASEWQSATRDSERVVRVCTTFVNSPIINAP